jgi:TonB family protein
MRRPIWSARRSIRSVLGVSLLTLALAGCGRGEIQPPVPLYGESPIPYPEALWDEGVEGVTTLRVRVTEAGEVDAVRVQESSGHEGLDAAAESGAWALRFEPGRRSGKRVRMWASIPVEFSTRPAPRQEPVP